MIDEQRLNRSIRIVTAKKTALNIDFLDGILFGLRLRNDITEKVLDMDMSKIPEYLHTCHSVFYADLLYDIISYYIKNYFE